MLRINEIIEKSGKKKGYIAKKLGISPATMTRYCKGYTSPNSKIIEKLSEILGVEISEFFFEKDNTII